MRISRYGTEVLFLILVCLYHCALRGLQLPLRSLLWCWLFSLDLTLSQPGGICHWPCQGEMLQGSRAKLLPGRKWFLGVWYELHLSGFSRLSGCVIIKQAILSMRHKCLVEIFIHSTGQNPNFWLTNFRCRKIAFPAGGGEFFLASEPLAECKGSVERDNYRIPDSLLGI